MKAVYLEESECSAPLLGLDIIIAMAPAWADGLPMASLSAAKQAIEQLDDTELEAFAIWGGVPCLS